MRLSFAAGQRLMSLAEFRRRAGLPLAVVRRLIVNKSVRTVPAMDGDVRIAEGELQRIKHILATPFGKLRIFVRSIGPGVITGASDDDPSGIGTYASVGAQYGLHILWMATWLLPMMMAIQETCARIGIVTRHGLAHVIKKRYSQRVVGGIVVLLIIANVINIAADLGAMAAMLQSLTGVNFYLGALLFAVISVAGVVLVEYRTYARILKWLSMSVLAYVFAGLLTRPLWGDVLHSAIVPEFFAEESYIFAMIAVFGTSITPYLFFWQASEEVEERRIARAGKESARGDMHMPLHMRLRKMRGDVALGMILANIVLFFVIMTTAVVLHHNGIYTIDSAEDAALALLPLAGQYAFVLFALGIIFTGLLAIPILASSGAYALAEVMHWREGLTKKFSHAKSFYSIIIASIMIGLLINSVHVNPIRALYFAGFVNGIIALPLLFVIMVIGDDRRVMGKHRHPWWVRIAGWGAILFLLSLMIAAVLMKIV